MWNTWSKRTKATVFITKKTNSISTKRWKSSSTNICIPKRQRLRARAVPDLANDRSNLQVASASLPMRHALGANARARSFLCLDERRRDVFRWPDIKAAAKFAVTYAVKEINQEPNPEPNKEADPSLNGQAQHQNEAKHDTENWKHRTHRNTERARPISVGPPQNDDAEANKNEGEECADIREISQRTDIDYSGDAADKNTGPNRGDVWSPESRMNASKVLREQTITRHRHKN